jgi:hypothetical protein
MRIYKPRIKTEKTIEIPKNLIAFLQDVQQKICYLAEETLIESDDLF